MALYTEFFERARWKAKHVSDMVPWEMLAAPGVIKQKKYHALQRTYLVRGQDLRAETAETQGAKMLQANNVLKRLGGRWMLQSEAQRSRLRVYPSSHGYWVVPRLIDEDRRHVMLEEPGARETTYFLTLTWYPPAPALRQAARLVVAGLPEVPQDDDSQSTAHLLRFVQQADYLMELLHGVLALSRPLTTNELLTYLHSTVSRSWHQVRCPGSVLHIDAQLCDTPYQGGWYPMLGSPLDPGSWHLRTCSVTGYPAQSFVGITRALEGLDLDYRWCTRWVGMEKAAQRALLHKMQHQWVHQERGMLQRMVDPSGANTRIIDSDATRKAEEADAARQELGADIVAYGDFTSSVTVWDTDPASADAKLRDVMQAFEAQGFTITPEKVHARQAWLATLPGDRDNSARRTKQHSLTLAHLLPGLAAAWPGPQEDTYLKGPPWFLAHTETSSAVRVVQHVREIGHFLMFGATRSGKSTALGFMVAQWFARYRGVQCFWWDMDRTARLLTLLLGGTWYELGTPGIAFQPLRQVDDVTARAVAREWLLDRVEEAGQPANGEVVAYISSTLARLAQEPARKRTISALVTIMAMQSRELDLRAHAGRIGADGMSRPDQRLEGLVATHHAVRMALKPYTRDGEYGWLFDADHDDLAAGPLHTFEQRTLYTLKRLVKPVTSYVFRQLEQRFSTDTPTLLPMDEAAITAALPAYADKYDEWLMVTAKKSVSLGFLINALHQITDEGTELSALGRMLQVNCPTRYFLPNAEAMTPIMRMVYAQFGLTETEMHMLATARPTQDVYYSCQELGKRMFHLKLSPFILDCLARNTQADHALMDTLLAQEGREGFATAWLRHHGYDEAAMAVERNSHASRTDSVLSV